MQANQFDSLLNDLLRLVGVHVTIGVPHHPSVFQPLLLHLFESFILKTGKKLIQSGFFRSVGKQEGIQLRISKLVDHAEIVVLILLLELFFDLFKNITTLLIFKRANSPQRLAHKVEQRVIEAAPLKINVITKHGECKRELRAARHVCELAERFLEHALPHFSKDAR